MSEPCEVETAAASGKRALTSAAAPAIAHSSADLVARFGSHWFVGYGNDEVTQALDWPRADDSNTFGSRDEAIEAARARRARKLQQEAESAARILGYWRSRMQISMARLGFRQDRSRLLQRASELREKVAAAGRGIGDWAPAVRPLPETMRGPMLLEVGRDVWRIRATWPLEEGVKVERLAVREIEICTFVDSVSGFDLTFRYVAGEDREAFRFSHNTVDAELVEIRTGYVNHWAFLTQEAARACVSTQAAKLRAAADAAERAVSASP